MIASRGASPDAFNISLISDVATTGSGDQVVVAEAAAARLSRKNKTPKQNPIALEEWRGMFRPK